MLDPMDGRMDEWVDEKLLDGLLDVWTDRHEWNEFLISGGWHCADASSLMVVSKLTMWLERRNFI